MKKVVILLAALAFVFISSSAYAASPDVLDLWKRLNGVWAPSDDEVYQFYGFHSYEYNEGEPIFCGGWFHSEGYSGKPQGVTIIGDNKYRLDYVMEVYEDGEEEPTHSNYQVEIDTSDLDKGVLRVFYKESADTVEFEYFAPSLDEANAKIESQW